MRKRIILKINYYHWIAVIGSVIGIISYSFLHFYSIVDYEIFKSGLIAIGFTSLNYFVGSYLFKIGMGKTDKTFLIIVFGGMVARFMVLLTVLIISIYFLKINLNSFIFAFFTFYIFFLTLEVIHLSKKENKVIHRI